MRQYTGFLWALPLANCFIYILLTSNRRQFWRFSGCKEMRASMSRFHKTWLWSIVIMIVIVIVIVCFFVMEIGLSMWYVIQVMLRRIQSVDSGRSQWTCTCAQHAKLIISTKRNNNRYKVEKKTLLTHAINSRADPSLSRKLFIHNLDRVHTSLYRTPPLIKHLFLSLPFIV